MSKGTSKPYEGFMASKTYLLDLFLSPRRPLVSTVRLTILWRPARELLPMISVLREERLDEKEWLLLSSLEELAKDEVDEGKKVCAGRILRKGESICEDSLEEIQDGDLSDEKTQIDMLISFPSEGEGKMGEGKKDRSP